jgi:hypothetical protein
MHPQSRHRNSRRCRDCICGFRINRINRARVSSAVTPILGFSLSPFLPFTICRRRILSPTTRPNARGRRLVSRSSPGILPGNHAGTFSRRSCRASGSSVASCPGTRNDVRNVLSFMSPLCRHHRSLSDRQGGFFSIRRREAEVMSMMSARRPTHGRERVGRSSRFSAGMPYSYTGT